MAALGTHEEVPPLVTLYKIAGTFIIEDMLLTFAVAVRKVSTAAGVRSRSQPRVISQPSGRGCNGNETQQGNGQHHHEDR
jgi:hypothetical protein